VREILFRNSTTPYIFLNPIHSTQEREHTHGAACTHHFCHTAHILNWTKNFKPEIDRPQSIKEGKYIKGLMKK